MRLRGPKSQSLQARDWRRSDAGKTFLGCGSVPESHSGTLRQASKRATEVASVNNKSDSKAPLPASFSALSNLSANPCEPGRVYSAAPSSREEKGWGL